MTRKALCFAFACLVLNLVCFVPASARTKPEAGAKFASKVKREIARLGTGPDARIQIRLRDKTRVAGYVSDVGEDTFAVTDAATGTVTVVAYPQVKQAKGNNLSTGARIAIGLGIAVAIVIIVAVALTTAAGGD